VCDRRRVGDYCRCSNICDAHRQLHRKFTNFRIGIDPRDANSWPLRSPGILSRRAPRGFLPRRQQLLDQPSTGCGTLATNSMIKVGARDMPDQATGRIHGSSAQLSRYSIAILGKGLGIAAESPALPDHRQAIRMRSILRKLRGSRQPAPASGFRTAVFKARCTDCNRSTACRAGRSTGGARRLLLFGTCSHDPLHHGDEPPLVWLA
jgi:hypothetical protein